MPYLKDIKPATLSLPRLLAYVADLELEVDRLRQHNQLVHQEVWKAVSRLKQIHSPMANENSPPELQESGKIIHELMETLRELRDPPGYHPSHDQVIAVAVGPLVEQIFRWQKRFLGAQDVQLQLELEAHHVEWFPARLRHLLDNLIANALKYRDPEKAEKWVRIELRATPEAYEVRVSDNGLGMESAERDQVFELFYRAAPAREAGLGVGLAVVKLLVEQSGGSVAVDSIAGQGSVFVVVLPRYATNDYL